ncbi:MAG: response regulator [Alphaproteobacteria bacterium]|nr:response regulator [Alphaproteobacteria bacterium]
MSDGPHILVVDDDSRLRELLRKFLSERGFRVTTAAHSGDAEAKLRSLAFDLLVLDVMMPGETGIDFTKRLRQSNSVPILLLTARAESHDRIAGLAGGADDYLAKPFEPDELLLRIRAILRRAPPPPVEAAPDIRFGPFRFHLVREELLRSVDGAETVVRLTAAEASLLKVLAEGAGTAINRADLLQRSRISGNERTVDVQMTRLRRKVEADPRQPRYLQTVRGAGYMLRLG